MSTTIENIEHDLVKLLSAQVGAGSEDGRPVRIAGTTDLTRDLGLESIQIMEFVVDVEDHYDISIPLERLSKARTVRELAAIVAREIGADG